MIWLGGRTSIFERKDFIWLLFASHFALALTDLLLDGESDIAGLHARCVEIRSERSLQATYWQLTKRNLVGASCDFLFEGY